METDDDFVHCEVSRKEGEREWPGTGPGTGPGTDDQHVSTAMDISEEVDDNTDNGDNGQLTAEQKSRLLAGATLNDVSLIKRGLQGTHQDVERQFLDRALLITAGFGHTECAQLLLQHGADINTPDEEQTPCWLLAVKYQHRHLLNVFLTVPFININATDAGFNSALHLASANNDIETAVVLLHAGCNPNLRNGESETPLIMASKSGSSDMIDVLLSGGADPYATKFSQRTAFHITVECGHLACVKVFLTHGIDIAHYDSDGRCSLHMSADKGYLEILRLLIRSGISVNILDHEHRTPLYEAVSRGHINCVGALVAAGARTDIQNSWGNTPIMSAVLLGQVDVLRLLLKLACDVNKAGFRKMTSLHCAALYGQVECTNMLLNVGADPNAQNCDGYTPAHFAVKSKTNPTLSIQTLRLLLHINANFEACGLYSNGTKKRLVTPFELALCIGAVDIACWLALAGVNMRLVQDLLKQITATCTSHDPQNQARSHVANQTPPGGLTSVSTMRQSDPMLKWLLDKASQPKSLMEMSRDNIRHHMGQGLTNRIALTGLPKSLQEYVIFKDMCENSAFWFRARNAIIMGHL